MLVCAFSVQIAHETAGAARTRSSLRPLSLEGQKFMQASGAQRREIAEPYLQGNYGGWWLERPFNSQPSLRAKRSNPESREGSLDCFVAALLAMTKSNGL
jgi:hypothetical protein